MIKVRKYLLLIYLVLNVIFIPIRHVKSVQDDISFKTIRLWLHDTVYNNIHYTVRVIFILKVRKYLLLIYLVLNVVSIPIRHVKSVQDDISSKLFDYDCMTLYIRIIYSQGYCGYLDERYNDGTEYFIHY